jgi:hypothetical protein
MASEKRTQDQEPTQEANATYTANKQHSIIVVLLASSTCSGMAPSEYSTLSQSLDRAYQGRSSLTVGKCALDSARGAQILGAEHDPPMSRSSRRCRVSMVRYAALYDAYIYLR